MARIASPAAYIAAVAALLLSGIGVGLSADSASADANCASAPSAASPAGQHWYYRFDRVKQRKCWYLHAIMALPNRAAAEHRAAPAEPEAPAAKPQLPDAAAPQSAFAAPPQAAFPAPPQLPFAATPQAVNAATAPQPAAPPPGEVVSSQPAPHVTVLAIRPVTAPFVGAASTAQAAAPEQTGEPPTPQIAPNNANVPGDAVAEPPAGAKPASVPDATDAVYRAAAPADAVAAAAARTHLANVFFLLALALGCAAALIAFCGKLAGRTRSPRRSGHPDDAWRSDMHRDMHQDDAPFLAPREPHGPAGSAAHDRIAQSPPARTNARPARRRDGEPRRSKQVGTDLKDIELALRALRQARQSMTQT